MLFPKDARNTFLRVYFLNWSGQIHLPITEKDGKQEKPELGVTLDEKQMEKIRIVKFRKGNKQKYDKGNLRSVVN